MTLLQGSKVNNDLLLQSVDDFVACDNDVEMCDSTITNLKIKCWRNTLSCKTRFHLKVIMKTKLSEENEASSSIDKCSKFSLASVRATLKCVEDIKSFPLKRCSPPSYTSV